MMKRILVIRFSAFGDVIMAFHIIKSFLEENKDYELILLTKPFFGKIFSIEKKIILPSIDLNGRHRGFFGLVRLVNEILKRYDFDYVLDLHNVLRSKILGLLFFLKGKKILTIDKGRREKKRLVKNGWTKSAPLKHTVERYADVFRRAGFSFEKIGQHFFETNCVLPEDFRINGTFVGIAPFAKHKTKIYPLEKTERLISELQKKYMILIFGGGENEKKIAELWQKKFQNVISVVGKTNLECEIRLIGLCKAFISMDSANMHLASLTDVPLISVWGGTHPYAGFSPFKLPEKSFIIQSNLACRPCSVFGKSFCPKGDFQCMTSIDETTIVETVRKILMNAV